ncbi:hypothetical protein CAEBREN_15128 [Caenorhabditis brenneri]|uniref:Uncharacterized protein n=1 Tax=Caenorhabditis brenneri TaxID=135651 RepID=G0N350_CAEBE|nr:hypothetical protein CAEBREN_15128 [Caenorhabditis brenneri]
MNDSKQSQKEALVIRPCSNHLLLFGKTRRPQRKNKIVCSNSSCFSSVMPIEIRKHPVTEKWICLSCYEKVSHSKPGVKTVGAVPQVVEHAPPAAPKDPDFSDTEISYEIYQEALKKYEELRKIMGDLPAV